jgi:FkbM family methyltransferase
VSTSLAVLDVLTRLLQPQCRMTLQAPDLHSAFGRRGDEAMADPDPQHRRRRRPTFTDEAPMWKVGPERVVQMVKLYRNWPSALANRGGLLRRRALYSYRVRVAAKWYAPLVARGNSFDVRTINEVFIGHVYDRWYEGPVPAGCVIDVGANCGYFSVLAGTVLRPTQLLCVEPDPDNRSLLEMNLAGNGLSAEIVAAAVVPASVRDEAIVLHRAQDPRLHTVVDADQARATGLSDRGPQGGDIEVTTLHLDDLVGNAVPPERRVSFLKIDIEGPEWDVLTSLSDEVCDRIDCVVVESDREMPREARQRVEDLGFSIEADRPFWAMRRV